MLHKHINWKQEEVRKYGLAYQVGATGLLIATVLPWRLTGFIMLIISAIITIFSLLRADLWCRIANLRWSTYISYGALLTAQLIDELWSRIAAIIVAMMISIWTQNILFRWQEELIRRTIERETAAKIIAAADAQTQ